MSGQGVSRGGRWLEMGEMKKLKVVFAPQEVD